MEYIFIQQLGGDHIHSTHTHTHARAFLRVHVLWNTTSNYEKQNYLWIKIICGKVRTLRSCITQSKFDIRSQRLYANK